MRQERDNILLPNSPANDVISPNLCIEVKRRRDVTWPIFLRRVTIINFKVSKYFTFIFLYIRMVQTFDITVLSIAPVSKH